MMTRLIRTFTAVICTIIIVACTCTDTKPRYYRHVEIDGRYSIEGRYPVTEELAKKINCYRFVFDDRGKISRIEYLRNGKPALDNKLGVASIVFQHEKDYEQRVYLNQAGRPAADKSGVYSIRLRLNENKHPVALLNYGRTGELSADRQGVVQYIWTIDAKGRRVVSIQADKEGKRIRYAK